MVDQRLVNYIQQQMQRGFDITAIRNNLIRSGYAQQVVDEATRFVYSSGQQQTQRPQQQVQQPQQNQETQLLQTIKQWLSQGYDQNSITNYLIQQGYQQQQIQNALNQVMQKQPAKVKHEIHVAPKSIAMIMAVVLFIAVIGGAGYYFLGINSAGYDELLDFTISIDNPSLLPGETLYFSNDFVNFGEKRRYDISVIYSITEKDTGELIDEWKEVFAIDTALTRNNKYLIPDDTTPGNYRLTAEVEYGDFIEDVFSNFKVYVETVEETCFDNLQNQDEEGIDCGGVCDTCETCSDGLLNQDEEEVDCGGVCDACEVEEPIIEDEEVVDDEETETRVSTSTDTDSDADNVDLAKATASSNPAEAADYCEEIGDNSYYDKCYNEVAKASLESSYCSSIVSDSTRDSCYVYFAFDHSEYDVCDYIINPFVKQSCDQLAKINQIQDLQETGGSSAEMFGVLSG